MEAVDLLTKKFYELHPRENIPAWMSYIHPEIKFDDAANIVYQIFGDYAYEDLGEDYFFKDVNGKKWLVYRNEQSGEEKVVLHHSWKTYVTLYKAALSMENLEIGVLKDTDFSLLKPNDFAGYWWLINTT